MNDPLLSEIYHLYLQLVEDAVMHTFKEMIQDRFTPELRSAWESFFGHLMLMMVDEI